ncbi:MAG TPA: IS1595 family transposase [Woeseiaceae bacterium]
MGGWADARRGTGHSSQDAGGRRRRGAPPRACPRQAAGRGRYAGRVRLAIAADRSAEALGGFVRSTVEPGTLVVTDDWSGYVGLRKDGYDHHAIAQCGDPEVSEEFMPIVHLVFSNLKTWLNGIHHGVSAKHLQAYLNEFTFRFNRRFYPLNAFRSLLGIGSNVEAPTFAELYSGNWTHPTCSGCLR